MCFEIRSVILGDAYVVIEEKILVAQGYFPWLCIILEKSVIFN
jgi:hypothetical protein